MSLRQYWEGVRTRTLRNTFQDYSPEQDEAISEIAQDAYGCCVNWFGQPLDPRKPYFVQQAVDGGSFCSRLFGEYCPVIATNADSPEQLCFHIAHEMYHRVTAGRRDLAGEM